MSEFNPKHLLKQIDIPEDELKSCRDEAIGYWMDEGELILQRRDSAVPFHIFIAASTGEALDRFDQRLVDEYRQEKQQAPTTTAEDIPSPAGLDKGVFLLDEWLDAVDVVAHQECSTEDAFQVFVDLDRAQLVAAHLLRHQADTYQFYQDVNQAVAEFSKYVGDFLPHVRRFVVGTLAAVRSDLSPRMVLTLDPYRMVAERMIGSNYWNKQRGTS